MNCLNEKKLLPLLLLVVVLQACSNNNKTTSPKTSKFNDDWHFIISDDSSFIRSDSAIWKQVDIPHTPVLEPLIVNDQWQGLCWYKKTFTLDKYQKGKKLFIKFDGAMTETQIWINGIKKESHLGGYLPFLVEFSEEANFDNVNEVIVRLDNHDNPTTGPKPLNILDFNTYGGLYRDVWLIVKNPIYITDPIKEGIPAGGGVFVTYSKVGPGEATAEIKTHIRNTASDDVNLSVEHQLWKDLSQINAVNGEPFILESGSAIHVNQSLAIKNPELWSPSSPNLYLLVTNVYSDEKLMDSDTLSIGIKEIKFIDNKLVLNGQELFLRGVNRHQEYPYIGYALSNEAQYRDATKIKESGFDYVRLSHYPHSPAFMAACDEIGLLVIDAILGWQYYQEDEAFQKHIYQTARDLVRRDRNHACVLAWEVSLNESWMPEYFIDSLIHIAHQEYPGSQCFTAGWQEYGYDIYLQARQHRISHYETPVKPYVVSEYGDWEYYAMNAGLNQDSWQGLMEEERTSRQLLSAGERRLLQQATNLQEAHNDNFNTPAFADGYWVMYDYNRGYADDLESSGISSINRLPKFSYYFFRSQRDADETSDLYSCGPMVYIASYWNEDSDTDIRVFSNCEKVALYLNDSLIGTQIPDQNRISNNLNHPPFTFSMGEFSPGTLKATGIINDKEVTQFDISTPGKPISLSLFVGENGKSARAGVNDAVFVYAILMDKNGNTVPDNGTAIEFFIAGDAALISPQKVTTEAGIASALTSIGENPGLITITAKGLNLAPAEITLISE